MQLGKLSRKPKKPQEMVLIEVPKKRLRRPFPLGWGIAALLLMVGFAVITQLQFNDVSADNLYQARLDTYNEAVKLFESQERLHDDCVASIPVRESYRKIFGGISTVLDLVGQLPADIFPQSEEALAYQEELSKAVVELIDAPVESELPPKSIVDCPPAPTEEPVRPTR